MEFLPPSRQEIGQYLYELTAASKVSALSLPTQEAVVDSVDIAFSILALGETHEPDPDGSIRDCAATAAAALLAMYEPWLSIEDPTTYTRLVSDPEFLGALTAAGCIAAGMLELRAIEHEATISATASANHPAA